jgi:ABC-type xylose transport system permease subunit
VRIAILMVNSWKKYVNRIPFAIASVCSIFAGGFMLIDYYFTGVANIQPYAIVFLAIALIFLGFTIIILMNDIYKIKK